MVEEKKNIPKVRFREFAGDDANAWELRKFGDILEFSVPNNNLSRSKLNYTNGNVKNVHYGDILVKFDSILNADNPQIPYINENETKNYGKDLLIDGDIVIADTAEDETTGKAVEIYGTKNTAIVSGLHTIVARTKIKFASYYLGYYMNSYSYHKQLLPLMQGIKVLSLSKANISKTILCYPKILKEQQKIGTIFKHIDSLITLHQRELDNYKTLKKTMLSKMFPKNDEKYPEIRFTGFADAWELRKLGEVKDVRDGTHSSPKYLESGYPLVTSKNLTDSGIDMSNVSLISSKDFEEINKRSKVEVGDIIFGMIGTIGNPVILDRDDFAIKNVALLKNKGVVINSFLIYLIKSNIFGKYIYSEMSGGTQKFLSLNQIRSFTFLTPNVSEQQQIGTLFKQLDSLITLHQRRAIKGLI